MDIRPLARPRVEKILAGGGLLIDLREVSDYLASHVPGSISMLWEAGPGFATRARDLLPLDAPLVVIDAPGVPVEDAADRLRGKGFAVPGSFDGLGAWGGPLASVRVTDLESAGDLFLLDVADPGTATRGGKVTRIPVESLWSRHAELPTGFTIGVLAGWGVRAASAVGILERLGHSQLGVVRTLPEGARPPQAGKDSFRVGGPG